MSDFPMLARFNAWANERLYDAAARLSDAEYRADRGTFFGSVHRTLNHILVVDRLWTRRVEGIDHGIRALDQILHDALAPLRAARAEEDRRLIAFVDGLDDARLGAIVRFRAVEDDGIYEARADHILTNLFNHQTHHRGQAHALLTRAGIKPPPLDLLVYLHGRGEVRRVGQAD